MGKVTEHWAVAMMVGKILFLVACLPVILSPEKERL
jgi:hypothetical protein